MDADLRPVVAAVAEIGDAELLALIDATPKAPQIARLLAWTDPAWDRVLSRRRGADFAHLPPEAAISPA
jgi:hypothetical protein